MAEPERVVAAAVKVNGLVHSLPAPARHHDVIGYIVRLKLAPKPVYGIQGFVTSTGRFVDRKTAAYMAVRAGQVEEAKLRRRDMLFSEDLW